MTRDRPRFSWLEIENFRGFRAKQRIDLDASAIVVSGPNGSGKTSFFDSLQWLLLGSVDRFEQLKTRRADDYLANRYTSNTRAVISAELRSGPERVHIRREGGRKGSEFTWTDAQGTKSGTDAELRLHTLLTGSPEQSLNRLIMSSGLMQQDAGRDVLQETPRDRYTHLTTLLGLDEIAGFADAARDRARALGDRATASQARRDALQADVVSRAQEVKRLDDERQLDADVVAEREAVVERLRKLEPLIRLSAVPTNDAQAALLQEGAQAVGSRLAALAQQRADVATELAALAHVRTDAVEELERSHAEAAKTVAAVEAKVARATAARQEAGTRASLIAELAVRALDLLSETCPVCGQSIEQDRVRDSLKARLRADSQTELAQMAQAVLTLQGERAVAIEARTAIEEKLSPLRADLKRVQQLSARSEAIGHDLETFEQSVPAPIELGSIDEVRAGNPGAIEQTLTGLRSLWRHVAELRAVLQSGPSQDQLLRASQLHTDAVQLLADQSEAMAVAHKDWEASKVLYTAAVKATAAVTDRRFSELEPLIRDIYTRLDPHPSFKDMRLTIGVYNGRPILTPVARDEQADVEADPLLHFSSAQANVAALSYFLALGWASGDSAIPFLLLDDPIQSMDDINVLGFADLCRHIRRERQLLVSTHDRRLAGLLERKLAPRVTGQTTLALHFSGWTPEGPDIAVRLVEPQLAEGADRGVVGAAA